MTSNTISAYPGAIYTGSMSVHQWNELISDYDKQYIGRYYVVVTNLELVEMLGVDMCHVHFKCLVDDYGNLVRMQ